jgi:glycogen debranching enzyme
MMKLDESLADRAVAVLRRNDSGHFVKPGPSVYPFQWNWDSALVAIGLARVAPERGRAEVRSLLRGQWADGMVPHIVFHPQDIDYSPGPEVWGSAECPDAPAIPTSGITQPPVLATAVRVLHEADPDHPFLEEVIPAIDAWHRWLHRERSLDGSGLVAILHPWESADNAPRFDAALARIGTRDSLSFARSDRRHLEAAERPTDLDYRRYMAIVEGLRRHGYRPSSLDEAPFAYVDLCFNAVFAVAEADLAWLLSEIGRAGERAASAAARLRTAIGDRWDEDEAAYQQADLHGDRATTETVADLFPVYAGVPDERQARRLFQESMWSPERFGPSLEAPWAVTTVSKSSRDFDALRYWRGPVWINVNWFLVRGLERAGLKEEAEELRRLTLRLVKTSGFAEYYHPCTGAPLGSRDFSWSAALTLDLLA